MNGWDAKIRQRNKEDTPSGSVEVDMPRMYATYFRLKSNEATRPRCTILSHNNFYYYFLIPKKYILLFFFLALQSGACVRNRNDVTLFCPKIYLLLSYIKRKQTNNSLSSFG